MVKYGLRYSNKAGSIAVLDSVKDARKIAYKYIMAHPGVNIVIWAWYKPEERYKDKGIIWYNDWNGCILWNDWDEVRLKGEGMPRIVKPDGSLGVRPSKKYKSFSAMRKHAERVEAKRR